MPASVPKETIDTDLPCFCALALLPLPLPLPLPCAGLGGTADARPPAVDGAYIDSVGPCPRTCDGGNWEAKDELRETEGRVEE